MWDFSDCNKLQLIAREIYENNGLIAAICHGPAIFANLKLSDDKFLVSGKKSRVLLMMKKSILS